MAHTLLENVNGEYYRNQSILTGKPNRIKVIVEDEADVAFWFDILNFVKPDSALSERSNRHRKFIENEL